MAGFDLSDNEWAVIEPFLPPKGRGPARKDDRQILTGIFYILRTGAPWRDLPERYGPHTTVYNRYVRWGARGVRQGIFEALATECEDALVFVDSSIVKAHRCASGAKGGSFGKLSDAHEAVAAVRFTPAWRTWDDRCALTSQARKPMTARRLRRF